ncbi:hypothetical protein AVEN_167149-1, partial [Araneus ventricosus]
MTEFIRDVFNQSPDTAAVLINIANSFDKLWID